MGLADSPLRDRAIFVQGAPRSGTTWLVMLLATHPQIAGVEAESHLFEFGVDRIFDNFEGRDPHLRGLRTYLEREEVVDLVRDLCDGVFTAMRSHVAGSGADFIVEKTPTSHGQGSLDLRRKRECYPDGWYIHIVRDGDAVTRSLMKVPWMRDRSEAACRQFWQECVDYTRDCLGDHPRYREVSYEALRADPGQVAGELFEWLGVGAGEDALATVRNLSRERFSELGVVPSDDLSSRFPAVRRARRAAAATRSAAKRIGGPLLAAAERDPESSPLGFEFARAMRECDADALRAITSDSVTLAFRSPEGDVSTQGEEARGLLIDIARRTFANRHVNEWWASTGGAPREWWTRAPGQPFWAIFFSAIGGDASRVDLAFGLRPEDERIAGMVIISAGAVEGRPLRGPGG